MSIVKRQRVFALIAMMGCACHPVLAQMQPLTDFEPLETYKEAVSCTEKDCRVTPEQVLALGKAVQLYKVDMPKVKRISLQVGSKDDLINVTIFPDTGSAAQEFGAPGGTTAVTYIFDSSGSHLEKKIYNR
ncbi:hypothetical protein C8J98_101389 [Luteibacter sp. OK325]|uniref:hypothetical protein n=1 Tax=Luteibacter sp. OK325 TaxID=2135670 RepID=UPI000D351832|nr:hypothetical protein [Luteibacter sp. OK325]PTR35126.1 hypothetical protein C8J98_101389 [Luteibacter sp. OK325]